VLDERDRKARKNVEGMVKHAKKVTEDFDDVKLKCEYAEGVMEDVR